MSLSSQCLKHNMVPGLAVFMFTILPFCFSSILWAKPRPILKLTSLTFWHQGRGSIYTDRVGFELEYYWRFSPLDQPCWGESFHKLTRNRAPLCGYLKLLVLWILSRTNQMRNLQKSACDDAIKSELRPVLAPFRANLSFPALKMMLSGL